MPTLYHDEEVQRWRGHRGDVADQLAAVERLFLADADADGEGGGGGESGGGRDVEGGGAPLPSL